MKCRPIKYILMLLIAGVTTGAVGPKPYPAPLEQGAYLDADDWFQLGMVLNNQARYHEAAAAFSKSLSIEPKNPLSWLNMGTAQALLGDYPPAIEALKESVLLKPDLALGFSNLAEVCYRASRFQEAAAAYVTLLTLWPNNPNAHYKLGLSYLSLNETGKAQAEYLSLKMLDPQLANKLLRAIRGAPTQ